MAKPRRRAGLPPELGVAALVVAASFPLGRLFRTSEIGSLAVASAGGSTAVAWGLRRMRTPALVAAAASSVAFLWFASLAFFRSAMFGPFPSARSLRFLWGAAVEGIRRSQTDAAPVTASVSFLVLVAFAIWATAWLADDAANKLRHPMLAIGVTVPLFVLPGTILEGDRRWFDAGCYLAAALWVLFQDERFRLSRWGRIVGSGTPGWRPGLAARLGFLAILIALIGTPILPGFSAPPGLRGSAGGGDRVAFNPLVSIRPTLGDRNQRLVFTVRSRVPAYWRLTALDKFDGGVWSSGPQRPDLPLWRRSIAPQNPAPAGSLVVQEFEIDSLGGPWVPAAYEPIRIEGIRDVGADPTTRTLITARDLRRGTRYTVRSRIATLTFEQLAAAGPVNDPALERYLSLPNSGDIGSVARIARDIVAEAGAGASTPFRQAVALQDHLRGFTYDEDIKLAHDIGDIETFLTEVRSGYCEQFAAAMAVMARTLRLPSRVVVGFAVGGPGRSPDEYVVTTRQAHAWVEIYIAGYGWVPFEPTPRTDSVVRPPYTIPQSASTTPTTEPTAEPTASPSASPTGASTDRGRLDDPVDLPGAQRGTSRLVVAGIALVVILVLLVLALPVASRLRRGLRFRHARSDIDRVSVRYLDFLDWCAAAGVARDPGETPNEHARRLAEASNDGAAYAELAALATGAVYAPANGADAAAATRLAVRARRSVAETLPRRSRLLARVGWGWWRVDPGSALLGVGKRSSASPTP